MQTQNRYTQISALALGIAGALAFGQVHASAFQLKENSVKAQGRAMAGSASALGDASVVANNPALMSTFEQKTVQGDVTAIDLSFKFKGGGTDGLGNPLNGGNGGDAGDVTPVPAFSFILPLHDRFEYLTLGAMVSAPFGLVTEYDRNWVGRYHAVKSDVKIIDLTLAASLKLSDRFSAGVGLVYERADVTLTNGIDFGTGVCKLAPTLCGPTSPYGPQKNDGYASVKGDDTGIGWIFGLSWRPTDQLSIGYTHRSEIDQDIDGQAKFSVPSNISPLLALAQPGAFQNTGGGAALTTPSVDTLSATYQFNEQFSLSGEISQTDWHSLKEIRIQFDNPVQPDVVEDYSWKDSKMYSLGGEYKINEAFTLRAGIARDESPISLPHRTPRMPDQDRNWYAIGLTWAPSENWELSGSYTRIQLADTPKVALGTSPSGAGQGAFLEGKYDGHANLFGFSAQYRF